MNHNPSSKKKPTKEKLNLLKEMELLSDKESVDAAKFQEIKPTLQQKIPQKPPKKNGSLLEEERYILLETLGEGGMGIVQLVVDCVLGREVALKRIKLQQEGLNHLSEKQQNRLWRLSREALITASLEHPNIIPLYDMQEKENGEIYFTMRKIEGETLAEILRNGNKSSLKYNESQRLSIFSKICDAVGYAHSKSVIHRDLKPENIMVGKFGEVYVMDWGIAKQIEPQEKNTFQSPIDSTFSRVSQEINSQDIFKTIGGLGTEGYMAPEQQDQASKVTVEADIFSLGKILRECFTGLSPLEEFQQEMEQDASEHYSIKGFPIHKKEFNSSKIPSAIQTIINKATAENFFDRYQSVQELTFDLNQYINQIQQVPLVKKTSSFSSRSFLIGALFSFSLTFLVSYFFWSASQKKPLRTTSNENLSIEDCLKIVIHPDFNKGMLQRGKQVLPILLKALEHQDPKVRGQAIEILGKMGETAKEASFSLIQMLKDEEKEVRQKAAEALKLIMGE